MRIPKTERGRTTAAWKLLGRMTQYFSVSVRLTPDEPLAQPGCGRRMLQDAARLLDEHAKASQTPERG